MIRFRLTIDGIPKTQEAIKKTASEKKKTKKKLDKIIRAEKRKRVRR